IGIRLPDGRETSYRYDAFGRRIAKTVDGHTTTFFWQGDQLVAESSPGHHRSYVYEPDSFRPLALLDGHGPQQVRAFHYQLDHLGTPQELTSHEGEIVWSARYDAYGKLSQLSHGSNEVPEQPLRFQGQYFDAESGLHYNRHRYYQPDSGRYLTPDPLKLAGGLNAYRYTPNPTGWVDPLGLSGNCPGANRPGCAAPDGVGGARVDEGEPQLPNISAQQRRERIDELAEENAYRRLVEIERATPGGHFLEKHGAQTTLQSQLERVTSAKNPTTGVVETYGNGKKKGQPKIPTAATHFFSHRDQLNAIHRAQLIFRYTDLETSRLAFDMGKRVGEGYKRGSFEYGQQTKAIVILDNSGRPKTAYAEFD
ncbi:RHS repeat domain-containing protein, partial [Pseudomonas sp. NPDC089569]|uniref:RHS repeat domain-containing protein n=1 Tax=Pseudomonas sp. NPDC089569 TaxID=3390722 RepID=UPI003CFC07DF